MNMIFIKGSEIKTYGFDTINNWSGIQVTTVNNSIVIADKSVKYNDCFVIKSLKDEKLYNFLIAMEISYITFINSGNDKYIQNHLEDSFSLEQLIDACEED